MRISPTFTLKQAEAIRIALKSQLEWEDCPPGRIKASVNALRVLDDAQRDAEPVVRDQEAWAAVAKAGR